jgi:hypothetical protein
MQVLLVSGRAVLDKQQGKPQDDNQWPGSQIPSRHRRHHYTFETASSRSDDRWAF